MFDPADRDAIGQALLSLARDDQAIVGAALTGSLATDEADNWSDIDMALAVDGDLHKTMDRWTAQLYETFDAQHHWDLPSRSSIYRVFLLPGWLEVDLAFTPRADFGPLGPQWKTIFGHPVAVDQDRPPNTDHLAGLGWHHLLHARACLARARLWQAEHWISASRDQVIALACVRLGHPASYAKGAHLLPAQLTKPLEATLVRSLDEPELQRALAVTAAALADELDHSNPPLASRLRLTLADLTIT